MQFKEFIYLTRSDLYRYAGEVSWKAFIIKIILAPGYKYSFLMRLSRYLSDKKLLFPLYVVVRILLRHWKYRYGIEFPIWVDVGPGLFINHFGGIILNYDVKIGKNLHLSHNVTLGQVDRGEKAGNPVIGDYVYIAPGAIIVGNVKIGNYAAIAAGAVVTDDVPDYGVAAGVPAKIVSNVGSEGYNKNLWEDASSN